MSLFNGVITSCVPRKRKDCNGLRRKDGETGSGCWAMVVVLVGVSWTKIGWTLVSFIIEARLKEREGGSVRNIQTKYTQCVYEGIVLLTWYILLSTGNSTQTSIRKYFYRVDLKPIRSSDTVQFLYFNADKPWIRQLTTSFTVLYIFPFSLFIVSFLIFASFISYNAYWEIGFSVRTVWRKGHVIS